MRARALVLALGPTLACLPEHFEELAEAAPVMTVALQFPDRPDAELAIALTICCSSRTSVPSVTR